MQQQQQQQHQQQQLLKQQQQLQKQQEQQLQIQELQKQHQQLLKQQKLQQLQQLQQLEQVPALPAKQTKPGKVSIVNQPLPEIPPSVRMPETSQIRDIPQPLSAANLDNYRSLQRSAINQAGFSNVINTAKQPSYSMIQHQHPPQPQARTTQQKHVAISSMSSKPTIPLPPKITPPTLPPKNRNKDQHSDGTATLSRQNNNYSKQSHQIQSGTSTLPPPQKSTSNFPNSSGRSANYHQQAAQQHQSAASMATYSTFGYDQYQAQAQERDNRRYQVDRDNNRQMSSQQHQHQHSSSSYGDQYKMSSGSSRQQQGYPTMPHKQKETTFVTSGSGSSGKERDRERERSYHHGSGTSSRQQYNQNPNSAMSSSSRRNADPYRQTSQSNRHGINMSHGHDPTDLNGKLNNSRYNSQSILQKSLMDMPMYNNDMYSVTEL